MLNHPLIRSSTMTGFACPETHEGTLLDGSTFQLYYRHGGARLTISRPVPTYPYRVQTTERVAVETHGGADGIFQSEEQRNSVFAHLVQQHLDARRES